MKKYIFVLFAMGVMAPALASAAPLTQQQASSLISVVQSSPGTPASAFTDFITSFSNITIEQANSLIGVVQAAPGVAPDAFVGLLIAFTQDQIIQPAAPNLPVSNTPQNTQPTPDAPASVGVQSTQATSTPAPMTTQAPAPKTFTGTVSASALSPQTTKLPPTSAFPRLATIRITNDRNEDINIDSTMLRRGMKVVLNETTNFDPSVAISAATIRAGQSRDVLVQLDGGWVPNEPEKHIHLTLDSLKVEGIESGDFIPVSGFPIDLGNFIIEE